MATEINHKELAISRLATEYKASVNLISYIQTLLLEAQNLEEIYQSLLTDRWIDTATNTTLDIIGSIVGQSRTFIDANDLFYFGFHGNPQSDSFGSIDNTGLGARFRAVDERTTGLRSLTDDEYRLWIRARIARNSTHSTPEDIIDLIAFVFPVDLILFLDGDTEYFVSIGKFLTINEKLILTNADIFPKTAGVKANYVTEFDSNSFFGFDGVPGSGGFGSLTNPAQGGKFGQLIF
jgi:hypothetical protein